VLHTCQIGCLRRQNFTWEVAGTSVGENPRWVRFHRIFVYACKQSNIMCSCCVWPHGNGLVGFYSLQKLFKLCFYPPAIAVGDIVIAVVHPSVTLSCLHDNLSKHGWIWIMFCMWLVIIIILDGFFHGNIWSKILGENLSFWLKNHQFWELCLVYAITLVNMDRFE
jgi:hypothetical protein